MERERESRSQIKTNINIHDKLPQFLPIKFIHKTSDDRGQIRSKIPKGSGYRRRCSKKLCSRYVLKSTGIVPWKFSFGTKIQV